MHKVLPEFLVVLASFKLKEDVLYQPSGIFITHTHTHTHTCISCGEISELPHDLLKGLSSYQFMLCTVVGYGLSYCRTKTSDSLNYFANSRNNLSNM